MIIIIIIIYVEDGEKIDPIAKAEREFYAAIKKVI